MCLYPIRCRGVMDGLAASAVAVGVIRMSDGM